MKRSRVVLCAALVVAGFFISGFFHSGRVDIASTASAKLLQKGAHIGAVMQNVPDSAKEGEGGTDAEVRVPPASAPHEAGPIDPWRPRPVVPPPGAMEHSGPWTRGPLESIQVS